MAVAVLNIAKVTKVLLNFNERGWDELIIYYIRQTIFLVMKIFHAFIATLTLIIFTQKASAQTASETAMKFNNLMGIGKAGEAYQMADPTVQGKIAPAVFGQIWIQLETKFGSWKSVKVASAETVQDMEVIYADNDFEKAVLTLKIVVNKANKIAGFSVGKVVNKEEKKVQLPPDVTEEPMTVIVSGGHLKGSLVVPTAAMKVPVMLIIAGSGPTDRNGNNILGVSAQSYLLLAHELAKKGIASMRYDKRFIGNSNDFKGTGSDATVQDFADDAVQCIKTLKADKRFSGVYIIGHSEGALLGMLASIKEPVAGYVSLCGAGEPFDKTIDGQIKTTMPDSYEEASRVIKEVKKSPVLPKVSDPLKIIFNENTVVFVHSLFQYEPASIIRKVKVPTLIIAGTHDLQIPVGDAKLLAKSNSSAKLVIIENMNHVLKQSPSNTVENLKTYQDEELPVMPELIEALNDFVIK